MTGNLGQYGIRRRVAILSRIIRHEQQNKTEPLNLTQVVVSGRRPEAAAAYRKTAGQMVIEGLVIVKAAWHGSKTKVVQITPKGRRWLTRNMVDEV